MSQTTPSSAYMSPFNRDPSIVRAIVRGEATKLGTKAVEFGMWVNEDES